MSKSEAANGGSLAHLFRTARLPTRFGPRNNRCMSVPEIAFSAAHRLAVCRPAGQLDADLAARLLDFILAMEEVEPEPFDRLLDLTAITEIRLSGPALYRIAQVRRAACAGRHPFRTAFLAPGPLAYATGKLYEELVAGCAVIVSVHRDANGVAAWLGVPRSVILSDDP
jgi:hypothetical protein